MTKAESVLLRVGGVLDRLNVPFFLILGACLGLVRDGHLIDGDRDIDVGCLYEDLHPKAEAIAHAFPKSRIISSKRHVLRAVKVYPADGPHVDIAGFIRRDDVRYCPSSYLDYCLVYPANILESGAHFEYLGRAWRLPNPPEMYCRLQYGDSWRTPNPKWNPKNSPSRIYGFYGRGKA